MAKCGLLTYETGAYAALQRLDINVCAALVVQVLVFPIGLSVADWLYERGSGMSSHYTVATISFAWSNQHGRSHRSLGISLAVNGLRGRRQTKSNFFGQLG
jgi:hypothetical protein